MTDLTGRVQRLERRLARRPGAGDVLLVSIVGGFVDDGPESAGTPGSDFYVVRGPDEPRGEFIERVRTAARAAGVKSVVVGGFSD